jgi:hypothetical protein
MDWRVCILCLLVITSVSAIEIDKEYYTVGEYVLVTSPGPFEIHAPNGDNYMFLGSGSTEFPVTQEGAYAFSYGGETRIARVSQPVELSLQEGKLFRSVSATQTEDDLVFQTEDLTVELQDFSGSLVRVQANLGRSFGFQRAFAVDPTTKGFGSARITKIAQGSSLFKCVDYNYTTSTCFGEWTFQRSLTPGQEYTILVHQVDPAFGEGDAESQPDVCSFSDEAGRGDGDSVVNCLTEVQTQNSGTTADLQDLEASGGVSQIQIDFTNSLSVAAVNAVNVTYRYQRISSTAVGATSATIQLFDAGAWTTVCTDTVLEGSFEEITCDLTSRITTQAELNSVQTRIQFSTAGEKKKDADGVVYVDYSYLAMDYDFLDIEAPTYSDIQSQAASPKTYDGLASNFSVDWQDNDLLDTVIIEHNFSGFFTNQTLTGGPTYTFSDTLGAGTYSWRQFANDSQANQNVTLSQTYIVNQAAGEVELLLAGAANNLTINEDTLLTINGSRITGETTLTLYENGAVIASGINIDLSRSYPNPGVFDLLLEMNTSQNYTADSKEFTVTVIDATPPSSVTALSETSTGESWILWNWTNPIDADFLYATIKVNGSFYANTSNPYINVTGRTANTLYEIQITTVDTTGNINSSIVSDTAQTDISLDVTPPVISNIQETSITDSQATITWDTDEPSDSVVRYSTTSGNYSLTQADPTDVTSHSILLSSLQPSTTYYYIVESQDPAANTAQSSEQSFTTLADTTPPTYTTITTTPTSPREYAQNITEFSVAWSDNDAVSTVIIEHNFSGIFTNDTMTGSGTYTYTQQLGVGTYSWKSTAQDSSGNENTSMAYQTYTVTQTNSQVDMLLNGASTDISVNEDTIVNLTAQLLQGEGILELLEDGLLLSQGYGNQTVSKIYPQPDIYTIQARHNQTQNYTLDTLSRTLTIVDITAPQAVLNNPFDGKTFTTSDINFSYTPDDNVNTTSCLLYLNGVVTDTQTPIEEVNNVFEETLVDGNYTWNVECQDAQGNAANGSARNFSVAIIFPWVPTTAIHSTAGGVTATVDASDGTTVATDQNEQIEVTTWSSSAPENANISALDASCEVDSASRGAQVNFQYNTGAGWSADICSGPTNGIGTFSCDLFAQGVDTVTELNALDVRCIIRDANGNPSARSTINYIQLQPDWELIELPDFEIISFEVPSDGIENTQIQLNATIKNIGDVGASATVQFSDSSIIGSSTQLISPGQNKTFSINWTSNIGSTLLTGTVDATNTVSELNESNNQLQATANISSQQIYYGSAENRFRVLAADAEQKFNWNNQNVQGNIYAKDTDASISMLNLRALTRDENQSLRIQDLATADNHLNMSGFNDNLNTTYTSAGSLIQTQAFNVFGVEITDVPTINSTDTSAFVTGILYDADADTNGFYDGEESLVFITRINISQTGSFGVYDYEITVPARLRDDSPSDDSIELFVEVQ